MRQDEALALVRDGHRTALKWHRARRHLSDMEFGPERTAVRAEETSKPA